VTVKTNRRPIILILNQYAHAEKGHTIHLSLQMEYYGLKVDGKLTKVGGKQKIATNDGYIFPLNIWHKLPYLDM